MSYLEDHIKRIASTALREVRVERGRCRCRSACHALHACRKHVRIAGTSRRVTCRARGRHFFVVGVTLSVVLLVVRPVTRQNTLERNV